MIQHAFRLTWRPPPSVITCLDFLGVANRRWAEAGLPQREETKDGRFASRFEHRDPLPCLLCPCVGSVSTGGRQASRQERSAGDAVPCGPSRRLCYVRSAGMGAGVLLLEDSTFRELGFGFAYILLGVLLL